MAGTGQVVKELLLELAQTERKTIPPFQAEKVARAQQEIREHNAEMTKLIHDAEQKVWLPRRTARMRKRLNRRCRSSPPHRRARADAAAARPCAGRSHRGAAVEQLPRGLHCDGHAHELHRALQARAARLHRRTRRPLEAPLLAQARRAARSAREPLAVRGGLHPPVRKQPQALRPGP